MVPGAMAQIWGEALVEVHKSAGREPQAKQRWGGGREGKGAPAKLWEKGKMILGISRRA